MSAATALLIVLSFVAGFGWGQWYADRTIRTEQNALGKGRLNVSMPLNPDDAEATLGLLQQLVRKVEHERKVPE